MQRASFLIMPFELAAQRGDVERRVQLANQDAALRAQRLISEIQRLPCLIGSQPIENVGEMHEIEALAKIPECRIHRADRFSDVRHAPRSRGFEPRIPDAWG